MGLAVSSWDLLPSEKIDENYQFIVLLPEWVITGVRVFLLQVAKYQPSKTISCVPTSVGESIASSILINMLI